MIKKIHYITGILLGLFIGLHIVNHLMIVKGENAHIHFMKSIRSFYRNPFVETILLLAVLTQVSSGITLARKRWNNAITTFEKLQLWSGLFFVYFLVSHTSAVLIGRHVLHLDTNLYYGASPLNNNPLKFYFIFHYGIALLAFFVHVGCAHHAKMKRFIHERTAIRQSWIIMILGVIITGIILFRMMQITIPEEYHYLPFGNYH
ncbi:MAG TPA: hypothetical protein VGK59_23325 [Ohtaekwangia sp.]